MSLHGMMSEHPEVYAQAKEDIARNVKAELAKAVCSRSCTTTPSR